MLITLFFFSAHTPERSGLLKKFTHLFKHKTPHCSPHLRRKGSARFTHRHKSAPVKRVMSSGAKRTPLKTLNIAREQTKMISQQGKKRELLLKLDKKCKDCGDNDNSENNNSSNNNNNNNNNDSDIDPQAFFSENNGCNSNNNGNNNDDADLQSYLSHPLEKLLLSSPHLAVSPALIRKFRTGPDSPLARHRRTRTQSLPHRKVSVKLFSPSSKPLSPMTNHLNHLSVSANVFSPSPQRIVRSAKRRIQRQSHSRTGMRSRFQTGGPGIAKRLEGAVDTEDLPVNGDYTEEPQQYG